MLIAQSTRRREHSTCLKISSSLVFEKHQKFPFRKHRSQDNSTRKSKSSLRRRAKDYIEDVVKKIFINDANF
jgi:hypothetical protein